MKTIFSTIAGCAAVIGFSAISLTAIAQQAPSSTGDSNNPTFNRGADQPVRQNPSGVTQPVDNTRPNTAPNQPQSQDSNFPGSQNPRFRNGDPLPPTVSPMQSPNQFGAFSAPIEDTAVGQALIQNREFDLFRALVQVADQNGELSRELARYDNYTVLAPTNRAFLALPQGAFRQLVQPENRDLLMEVLSYHIVPRGLQASEVQATSVTIPSGGTVTIVPGNTVQPQINASGGVIYSVDRVILPPDVQARLNTLFSNPRSVN